MMFRLSPTRRGFLLALAALAVLTRPLAGQEALQTGLSAFENISVGTADRNDVSRLTEAGVVSIEGARGLVVTIAGELRGRTEHEGAVGVLLLPDLPFFTNLYRSRRSALSASEFTASIGAGRSGYFMSKPKYVEAGFSRYRILLFNTTGSSVLANVYVYSTRN